PCVFGSSSEQSESVARESFIGTRTSRWVLEAGTATVTVIPCREQAHALSRDRASESDREIVYVCLCACERVCTFEFERSCPTETQTARRAETKHK
uniref:Uncharacterized protein n=1 Tax=Anopheles arabiensis TaxID=7173 RepID=A0A182IGY9_ANOAR